MNINTKLLLGILFFLPIFGSAQEQLGLRFENYSGVNSIILNPANNLTSKFKWDVNLVEVGVFVDNNYAYIRNSNIIQISQNSEDIQSATDFENPNQIDPNILLLDYFDNDRSKYVSVLQEVMGPSFMVNLESGHSFGISSRARVMAGGKRIPSSLGYYNFENILEGDAFSVPSFKVAGMAWTEFGLNYARKLYTNDGSWGFGVSAKLLNGYEAFFVDNKEDFLITRFPSDSIAVGTLDLNYGFTTASINTESFSPQRNGGGFGLDLGAIWTIDESDEDYKLKMGVSLIDIGKISFNRNVQNHSIQFSGTEGFDANDFDVVTSIDQGTDLLSEMLLGDSTLSSNPGKFGIWLPTALSIQADYQIVPMLYANATLVQGIPMPGPALSRDNILALSPRLEHRWFSFSLPLVLHNWQDFRVGTSIRLAFLTLGSDNITSIFGNSNVTGTDFYLALKVNPFKLNFGGGGGKNYGGKGKNVKCYDF